MTQTVKIAPLGLSSPPKSCPKLYSLRALRLNVSRSLANIYSKELRNSKQLLLIIQIYLLSLPCPFIGDKSNASV